MCEKHKELDSLEFFDNTHTRAALQFTVELNRLHKLPPHIHQLSAVCRVLLRTTSVVTALLSFLYWLPIVLTIRMCMSTRNIVSLNEMLIIELKKCIPFLHTKNYTQVDFQIPTKPQPNHNEGSTFCRPKLWWFFVFSFIRRVGGVNTC